MLGSSNGPRLNMIKRNMLRLSRILGVAQSAAVALPIPCPQNMVDFPCDIGQHMTSTGPPTWRTQCASISCMQADPAMVSECVADA